MLFQFPMMLQGMLAATLQWRQLHHLCAPKLVLGFLISILRFHSAESISGIGLCMYVCVCVTMSVITSKMIIISASKLHRPL